MFARRLLRLYPPAWRRRYGEEMAALLEDRPPTFATYADLLVGAFDAHLNYSEQGRMAAMVDRLKVDVVVRFCAFVLFGIGWLLLARVNDPLASFSPVAAHYPGILVLLDAFKLAGVFAAVGIALGGLPLVGVAVRRALAQRQRGVLRQFAWAGGSALVFAVVTLAAAVTRPTVGLVAAYLAGSLLLLATGTLAVVRLILKADLREGEVRWLRLPAVLVGYGMAVALLAALALGALVVAVAPSLLVSQDVSPTIFTVGILLLGLGNAFAVVGGRRTWLAGGAAGEPHA